MAVQITFTLGGKDADLTEEQVREIVEAFANHENQERESLTFTSYEVRPFGKSQPSVG